MSAMAIAPAIPRYGNIKAIRSLIWVYFFLLIFEGFLRMLLPSASNALLVVRDPVLIAVYVIALLSGVFPWNRYVMMLWLLGAIALVLGFMTIPHAPMVVLFGFRACFFHVPLMFLMQRVMDENDVVAIGRWFLLLSIPIAILMAIQFRAGPDSWLNRGLDMQFKQIDAGTAGKIRPPGTFSYVEGPALFYAFVVAFLLYDQFQRGRYSKTLVMLASAATCLALAVSISRSALSMAATVVLAGALAVILARPKAVTGLVKFGIVIGIALFFVSQLPVFDEGTQVFSNRISNAGQGEGGLSGFLNRAFGDFIAGIEAVPRAGETGVGLGMGTNAGGALTEKQGTFFGEQESARVVLEMGPLVGLTYLAFRVGLAVWLLLICLKCARSGTMLPMLMLGACGFLIVSGQWGQPTELGFAAFGGGLCLTAMRKRAPEVGTASVQ